MRCSLGILSQQLRHARCNCELPISMVRDCLCHVIFVCFHIFFMHASPQFPEVQKKLNDNHLVAFIIAKFDIEAGEELLWKYDISQGYRLKKPPPTPKKRSREEGKNDKQGQTDRVEGCRCTNPCSTIKNCLTPQDLTLKPRVRGRHKDD